MVGVYHLEHGIIVSANDREQAESRVFQTMKDLIEKNPSLAAEDR
jgi:hypothetical protein